MFRTVLGAAALSWALMSAAQAQSCQSSFRVEGTPLLTALNYKASQVFPRANAAGALDSVARAVAAEGFDGIRVDKALGAISAVQETSGSGRPQTLRVVVRKSGAGARVDAVFSVQMGQVAPEDLTRAALCRVVGAAVS